MIKESMPIEGATLSLDAETIPDELYRVLCRGLQRNPEQRDLALHEIRDAFLRIKVRGI